MKNLILNDKCALVLLLVSSACGGNAPGGNSFIESENEPAENEELLGNSENVDVRIQRWFWSFGECIGACAGEVRIQPGAEALTIRLWLYDHEGETLFSEGGEITNEGLVAWEAAWDGLSSLAPLEEIYGCPDCDDGGAAGLEVTEDGNVKFIAYHFEDVPAEMERVDLFYKGIRQSILSCTDSIHVLAAHEFCEVYEE